jgi:hypothetical protein
MPRACTIFTETPFSSRLLILTLLASSTAWAQPELLWARQLGTVDYDYAEGLAADGRGGVYVAGGTWADLFGDHFGGWGDAFVARFGPNGDLIWGHQFGTDGWEEVTAAASDSAGGVFLAGGSEGTIGDHSYGEVDAYLARMDGDGAMLWIGQFGTSSTDHSSGVAPDGSGGALVCGVTFGALGGPNAGSQDGFVARFDAAGTRLWAEQFGSDQWDYATAVAGDGAGGAFVAGITPGSLGGPNAGKEDALLARIDASGAALWFAQLGSTELDWALAVACDDAGGAYIAGLTMGDLGGLYLGGSDAFLARFDGDGKAMWVRKLGVAQGSAAYALTPDGAGGVLMGGAAGNMGGPYEGSGDGFVVRYDDEGAIVWSTQFGSTGSDEAQALAVDGTGGVYAAGYTNGSLGGPLAGDWDGYVAHLGAAYGPDCDGSGVLDLFDFLCFVNLFNAGAPGADCDGNHAADLFDFLCFVNAFNYGC